MRQRNRARRRPSPTGGSGGGKRLSPIGPSEPARADWFRDTLKDKGIAPLIPGRTSRGKPIKHDKRRYRPRDRTKIMFGRLKNWRRVAPGYDRCPKVFLSTVAPAATVMFCR
jgi:hypothetical protein